jgi:hypothetical protein
LLFEMLLARPVPAQGGARGVNRYARFAPQSIEKMGVNRGFHG